ncbi:hypothetical protein WJX73_006760 [Symbiochloris irregularis]|uniref:DNA polymerase n=1 Tax=Symbiochloris irregularis TaxID=706552 RepID=A0AAW1NT43_9CHLO
MELFESHVDVQLKFLHQTGLKSSGWLRLTPDHIDAGCYLCEAHGLSNLDDANITALAPLVIASYDIEAFSPDNRFPDANKEGDALFMIATTFQRLGEDQPYLRHLVTLDSCASILGVHIETAVDEGYSDWRLLSAPGILNMDLHVIMKREHDLDSYKLDAVARHFIGEHKIDLSAKDMFAKVMSMLVKKMHQYGMICPSRVAERESYQGSTILEAKKGLYTDPVAVCDFASLYPSIIRRHCLCPSRLVIDDRFANLDNVLYMDANTDIGVHRFAQDVVSHGDALSNEETSAKLNARNESDIVSNGETVRNHVNIAAGVATAADTSTAATGCQGPSMAVAHLRPLPPAVLPSLLAELAEFRKQAKNDLQRAEDPWQRTLLDAKQKAFKVCMNSVYGAFGAPGPLYCRELASTVTAIGRQMIEETKRIAEQRFQGAQVVYGDTDSVFIKFMGGFEDSFRQGEQLAELITQQFGFPVKLELEKVFWPLLLVAKQIADRAAAGDTQEVPPQTLAVRAYSKTSAVSMH